MEHNTTYNVEDNMNYNDSTDKEKNITYFKDPIFQRNLDNQATYYILMINGELIYLTEDENDIFNNFLNDLPDDFMITYQEISEILKNVIQQSDQELPYENRMLRASISGIDWVNWQNNSSYNNQELPYKTFKDIAQVPGQSYYSTIFTYRNQINVTIRDTIPYFDQVEETLTIPKRPGRVPAWPAGSVTWAPDNLIHENASTTTQGREQAGNRVQYSKGDVSGNFRYQPSLSQTTLRFQNSVRIFIPNQKQYKTTAKDIGRDFKIKIRNPQVVKVILANEKDKSWIRGPIKVGLKKAINAPVDYTAPDIDGMVYKNYQVLENNSITSQNNSRTWKGKLNLNKRAIVFYYEPIPKEYVVNFDSNGGNKIPKQTVKEGQKAKQPSKNPTNENKKFIGWYEDKNLTKKYNFNSPVYKNITLYAKWENPKTYTRLHEVIRRCNRARTKRIYRNYCGRDRQTF